MRNTVPTAYTAVPIAVTVALLVATVKGSLVACYFMHLISEKTLILAVLLLTVVFFINAKKEDVPTELDMADA